MENENLLDSILVRKTFINSSVPAVMAQLINILYNLVEKMFIGHIPVAGKQALAGMAVAAFAAIFLLVWAEFTTESISTKLGEFIRA